MLSFVSSLFRSLDTITIAFAPFNLYTLKFGKNFFLKMPIQHLSLHFKVHLTLKNARLPLVFFLDFNSPWYDLRWHGIVIF